MKKILYSFTILAALLIFSAAGIKAQNVVQDSSFEGGTPSGTWTESSTNFGTPLCDAACGTCGGPCAAHTGSWYAWFGGFQGGTETGICSQSVTVPTSASQTNLSFWLFIAVPNGSGTDQFAVLMGTDTVFTATDGDSTTYGSGYTQVVIDAEAYEGTTTTLTFWSETTGSPGVTNFLLDDISLGTQTITLTEPVVKEHLSVFPTPATEDLTIDLQLSNKQDVQIDLVSMTGAVVYSATLNNIQSGKLDVDVRELAAGTYFLNVTKADGKALNTKVTIR